MRELVMNGEPKLYHSEYTPDDINNFLIDVTCQAYQETGVTLEVIDKGGYTLRKTLLGNVKKDKLMPPVLRHHECLGEGSFDCDYILYDSLTEEKMDSEELIKRYATEGKHLKIVRVYISAAGDQTPNGYHIKMDSQTIFPIQSNYELPKQVSSEEVAEIVKMSYEKLDSQIMEPYLDCDVNYQSFVVFNEITSRDEFLDYINGKFRVWKEDGTYPEITITKNTDDSYFLMFNNMITEGTIPALCISISKGRVVSFYMSATLPPIDVLLPLLKETPGELDQQRLLQASSLAAGSIGSCYDKGDDADFQWLQHLAQRPCCQHMCFIYKSLAVSIYIAPVDGDIIYVSKDEMNFYEQFRRENNLTSALLPVSLETLAPLEDGLLLDPNTLEPLDLESLNSNNKVHMMSPWEVNAMACFEVGNFLFQKGYQISQTTNVPGLYPQFIAYAPDSSVNYFIINSVAVGNKDSEQTINIQISSKCKEHEGFFVNRVYSNKWNDLNFNEVELLRQGGHYSNEIELIPLSQVEVFYPNIHLNITYFEPE